MVFNHSDYYQLEKSQLVGVIDILTEVVQQGLDLSGVMILVTEKAQQITGADGAAIELNEDGDMVYRAVSGIAEKQLGLRIKADSSLSGTCFKSGVPLLCMDSETDDRVDKVACRQVGLRSMALVPLFHAEVPVGVLKVFSSNRGHFSHETTKLLTLISGVVGSSMANATKYESDELFYRATYDALTGLANRALFYDRLRQRCSQAKRSSETFAVISADMDGLKYINDTFGHRAGDEAIKEVAFRIQKVLRDADTVARLGGDEFGIIAYKVKYIEEATQLVTRLKEMVQRPFHYQHHDINLSVSAGFALFDESHHDMEDLVEQADQKMYQDKINRRGNAR